MVNLPMISCSASVALLAEGVGRNVLLSSDKLTGEVALLAEGVGRNPVCVFQFAFPAESPSSRRAWVEIRRPCRA